MSSIDLWWMPASSPIPSETRPPNESYLLPRFGRVLQPFSCLFPHPVHDRDEVALEFADIGTNLPGSEDLAELAVRITFGVVQPVEEFGIGFQKSLVSVAVEVLLEELESQPVAREAPGRQAFLLFGQKLRQDLGDGGFCEFRVAGRLYLYFRSLQVMPQYFFALTLPI